MKTQCSDWHRGWGYGGYNKIGTLSLDDGVFTWKGHSQGRHLQKWGRKTIQFILTEFYGEEPRICGHDWIQYIGEQTGLPDWRDLKEAIEKLLNPPPPKVKHPRVKKTSALTNQLSMF